tara:strand:+ start:1842 stop:2600 length:759 start_codon:yes stop_codon:yes gene_type:complete
MKKKICPPGKICITSNILVTILIFVILILLFFIFSSGISPKNLNIQKNFKKSKVKKKNCIEKTLKYTEENHDRMINKDRNYNNKETNIIIKYQPDTTSSYLVNKDYERTINNLLPPERRNNYIDPHSHMMVSSGVPINIPTRGYTGGFQQIGTLHKIETTDSTISIGQNNDPVILPLMGCPTYVGSNKWSYYTSTDKFNQIKLPITNKNRKCDSEYGCDELYDDDIVTIPAYNGSFKVKKYEFDKPRYLPFV